MNRFYKDSSFRVSAIICGAGKGTRAGLNENKIFTVMPNGEFLGKTSFSYSELLSGGVKVRKSKIEAK